MFKTLLYKGILLKLSGSLASKISLFFSTTGAIATLVTNIQSEVLWSINAFFIVLYLITKILPATDNYDITDHISPVKSKRKNLKP